jgi:hypothetical protein
MASSVLFRDLLVALTEQTGALLLASMMLDEGQFANATARISIAFWIGVFIIIARRSSTLTKGDHLFIRHGLLLLLLLGLPSAFTVWAIRGVL